MDQYEKVCSLDNVFEAQRLEAALTDRAIPFVIENHQDSAYNGIFQAFRGWGTVKAPPAYHDQILSVLHDLRAAEPLLPDDTDND